jgi:hypothetical protein
VIFIAIIFLWFLFQPRHIFAVPTVNINNISDTNILGDNFSVDFSVANGDIGSSFYYKVFGGISDNTSSIQTFNNNNYLNYTSSWADFPILAISTSSANFTAYGKANNSAGLYNIRIRIAKISNTSTKYDSEAKTIDIIGPTPTQIPTSIPPTNVSTPTLVPTLKPTNTPTPTKIPTSVLSPTKISTSSSSTTDTPTPEPTQEIILSPTNETSDITDIPKNQNQAKNFIPIVLIGFGALLLFVPLFFSKIIHWPKKSPKN